MYERLTAVDDLTRDDHYYLEKSDNCYFFGEYTARKGFHHSATNQLVWNLKKCVSRAAEKDYKFKADAIETIAQELTRHIINPHSLTFIPVPPSKSKADKFYDDRLSQVLIRFSELSENVDWREPISQMKSTRSSHTSDVRLSPKELIELYQLDNTLIDGVRETIIIFDDMLTTGSHFRAVKTLLHEKLPEKVIVGIFIARRVPEADTFDIF